MYLYVFTFLLMAIIGLYTQVFMLGISKMESRQKTVAEVMKLWHDEAFALASENIATLYPPGNICALSNDATNPSGAAACNSTLAAPANITVDAQFNSIAYRTGGHDYVVTYVTNDINGYAKLGYRAGEIQGQLKKSNIPPWIQGAVSAGNCNGAAGNYFFTAAIMGSGRLCYPIVAPIPAGAVGLASMIQ